MTLRRETKYTLPLHNIDEVRSNILSSKFSMRKSFENRYVNSIYLDSLNYDNYNENLTGLSQRSKTRIRWYSNTEFGEISSNTELILEIKNKLNFLGNKKNFNFKAPKNFHSLDCGDLMNIIRNLVPVNFLPFIDHCNTFPLAISYEREYFEDFTKNIRATIDSNIAYAFPQLNTLNFSNLQKYYSEYSILELKYPQDIQDKVASLNFEDFGITAGRHSKYVVGIRTVLS